MSVGLRPAPLVRLLVAGLRPGMKTLPRFQAWQNGCRISGHVEFRPYRNSESHPGIRGGFLVFGGQQVKLLIINILQLIYRKPAGSFGKMSAEKAKIRTFVSSLREIISNLSSGLSPVYLLPPIRFYRLAMVFIGKTR